MPVDSRSADQLPPVPLPPQTQLRAQLVNQLKHDRVLRLGPPANERVTLRRMALNHMIAGYLDTVSYGYSLTVFREESAVSEGHALTEHDLLDVMHIAQGSFLHTAMAAAQAHGGCRMGAWPCMGMLHSPGRVVSAHDASAAGREEKEDLAT